MTDWGLVAKKLAFIETCLADLRRLVTPEEIVRDLRAQRFAEHTLQVAIQAALDVASHIVSDERLGEPATNRDLYALLARAGWIGEAQVLTLGAMAGFRNVLVHGYTEVDPALVRDVVEHRLADLEGFVAAIRRRSGG